MTYNNNFPPSGGLGLPTAGFASRGKAAQLKRLSVNPPASIPENQVETVTTPRTARGHLLAGLRTAPKTPTSAPFGQTQHRVGLDSSRYADNGNVNSYGRAAPQTASAATFASAGYAQLGANPAFSGLGQQQQQQQQSQQQHQHQHQHQQQQQQSQHQHQQHSLYPLLEQPLAPPSFNLNAQEMQQMDPEILADMMRQSLYLEQKRKLLEQQIQLISLQAQHSQGLTFSPMYQQQFPATPMTPTAAMLGLAGGNGVGLVDEAALLQSFGLGAAGVDMNAAKFAMGNNQAGQYGFMSGSNLAQAQLASSPPPATPSYTSSPPKGNTPIFRAEVSPPGDVMVNPFERRTPTPPKSSPSPPRDVTPLPPTSANGWRRGHKKVSSLAFSSQVTDQASSEGPKTAVPRPVGMPQTPVTGTFGPGQGRAGEHPVRQPRGPPPMDELTAAPTTKHEGSKNFASRQRRGALSKLVRAGMERRGGRTGSAGSMTPVSETDPIFSLAGSDNDSDSGRSLSGKPSIGSLRARASGAIGSERKEKNERSRERDSLSSDDGVKLPQEDTSAAPGGRRGMPMMLLNSAEKRKNAMY
jgi:hypothetical protein